MSYQSCGKVINTLKYITNTVYCPVKIYYQYGLEATLPVREQSDRAETAAPLANQKLQIYSFTN